jgi:acyl-CoA synthetase (NDP forming)
MANGLMAVPENSSVLKGRVALISRDFCISGALLNLARKKGISKFIGVGEGMGIREGDILGYMAQDKETSVICTYVEEATDGRKLVSAVKESVVKKPVLLVKGGAESAVFNNVMRQAGLLLVHNIREMLNGASALARQPPMLGDRVAIVTNSAGQGKLIKKYLLEEGLKPSKPSDAVVEKIKKKQPLTKVEDFIFLWHTAKADLYKFVAEQLLSDENLDGVVLVISIKTTAFDLENLNKIVDVTKTSKEKPIIGVLTCADDYTIAEGITATTDFPVYIHPDEAAKVLKILRLRGKQLGKLQKVL